MTQAVDSENAKCVIISLREKGPNTRFFPVNLCSPNTGKYGPEKTPYMESFHAVYIIKKKVLLNMRRDTIKLSNSSAENSPE